MTLRAFGFRQTALLLGAGLCLAVAGYGVTQIVAEINHPASSLDQVALEEPVIDMGDVETEVIHEIKVRVKHVQGVSGARVLGGGIA